MTGKRMQRTLELYCKKNAMTLEKALEDFSMTSVYNALYDFETGLWREGLEYLLDLFQKEIQK